MDLAPIIKPYFKVFWPFLFFQGGGDKIFIELYVWKSIQIIRLAWCIFIKWTHLSNRHPIQEIQHDFSPLLVLKPKVNY